MDASYILPDAVLTMQDYRRHMTRGHEYKETPSDLKEQQLRKYEVIEGQFDLLVSKQTEWTADDARCSERRVYLP
jgi:hypothetical protein